MQINIKDILSNIIHNTYTLRLIDSITGEIKQTVKTTNVVLNTLWRSILSSSYYDTLWINGMVFGSGSGTPQATDTAMFKQLWKLAGGFYPRGCMAYLISSKKEGDTRTYRFKLTVPANTSYVGTVTEIGLNAFDTDTGSYLITHAMLKDAEGNNISIEKTDIDKLEVEVELRISSYVDETLRFESPAKNGVICYPTSLDDVPTLEFDVIPDSLYAVCTTYRNQYYRKRYFENSKVSYSSSENKSTITGGRLTTGYLNGHYINAIIAGKLGLFKLPNSNLMPPMTVTGLPIGTGDGVATEFEPPLGLFIKDSDKVYIDGVQLTRGVDYTIDNKANRTLLHEITPGNFIKNVYGNFITRRNSFLPFAPVIAEDDSVLGANWGNNIGSSYKAASLDGNHPITMELEEDPTIGLDVNGCLFRYFYIYGPSGSTSSFKDVDMVLAYSNDNSVFTEVGRVDLTGYSYGQTLEITFDTVKAKYWRVSLDFTRATESEQAKRGTHYIQFREKNGETFTEDKSSLPIVMSMLYYRGEPIKFTNPPAEGAVITMDCTLDRPYKTENWVIDFNYEIQV